jgi:uncharacterized caspase-like protein
MRWWLTALFMVTGCLAATQAIAERRVALVVGNSQYAYTARLPNPRNDAEDIARVLGNVGFEVTVGYDLDQVKFAVTVAEFARALEGADVGLFFYAGHGLQIDGKNFLVSTQAKLENTFLVSSETLELDNIIRVMESKAGISLVFLDACRNNPLVDNLKRNSAAVNRAITVGRGLAPIAPGRDTLVAFSAASGEVAADGSGRNSPFAASLVQHLTQPGLEISVMLKNVTADVRQATNNAQRPQQFSDMSKTFYFVKAEQAAAAAAPAPLPPSPPAQVPSPPVAPDPIELAFWQSASAANECGSMRAYLAQYPDGRFAALGRVRERQLCKTGPEVVASPVTPPAPAAGKKPQPFLPASSVDAAPADAHQPVTPPPAPVAASPAPAAGKKPQPFLPAGSVDVAPADAHQPVTPPPAPVAAPSAPARPVGPGMTIATAPADVPASTTPVARPAVVPDVLEIGQKLQRELARVGCAANGMETDGSWGPASRDALRAFIERTHTAGAIDRPTPEALEAVQSRRERVCPQTRHHASPPPQRERPERRRAPRDEQRWATPQSHVPAVQDCIRVQFPQCSRR